MQRIQSNKTPAPGTQRDYSLVGNNSFPADNPNVAKDTRVKHTMGPIDRSKANIEVEGGETAVGDINNDGFLEHFHFKGKRHSKGGMPVNLPDDTFVYSDTPKMRIKDEEVQKMFGLSFKKEGYTPAEIAKQYHINRYIAVLKDDEEDELSKRTAGMMLKNNTEKLAMLALIQESMKGFPNGVPAIAEGLMESMGGGEGQEASQEAQEPDMEPEQPQMKYGGIARADIGGDAKAKIAAHKKKVQAELNKASQTDWRNAFSGFTWDTPGNSGSMPGKKTPPAKKAAELSDKQKIDKIRTQRGWGQELNRLQIEARRLDNLPKINRDKQKAASAKGKSVPVKETAAEKAERLRDAITEKAGAKFRDGYELPDPIGAVKDFYNEYDLWTPDLTGQKEALRKMVPQMSNHIPNYAHFKDYVKGSDTALKHPDGTVMTIAKNVDDNKWYYKETGYPAPEHYNTYKKPSKTERVGAGIPNKEPEVKTQKPAPESVPVVNTVEETASTPAPVKDTRRIRIKAPNQQPAQQPQQAPAASNVDADGDDWGGLQYGGELPKMQVAGEVKETATPRPDANAKQPTGVFMTRKDGTKIELYYVGNNVVAFNPDGSVYKSKPRADQSQATFTQLGGYGMNEVMAAKPNWKHTKISFGQFPNQPVYKNTGIYMPSNNAASRTNGDLTPEEWADFEERHKDLIDGNKGAPAYDGGFAKFKADLQQSKATGNVAAKWFQNTINTKYKAATGSDYFGQPGGANPYTLDDKFGVVTFSVPNFYDEPVAGAPPTPASPATTPEKEMAEQEGLAQAPKKGTGPWWLQDINTFAGAMTDDVNRYEPMKAGVDLTSPGYTLMDPSRMLAAGQESANSHNREAFNALDGNTAMASMLGDTGETLGAQANVLAGVENQNVGIVNAAYKDSAQSQNEEAIMNANASQKYVGEMSQLNENYDKQTNERKWRQINAFNNGTSNWFKKKHMEQVLFPQVNIDSITGDAAFSGTGRDPLGADTYQSAYGAGKQPRSNPTEMVAGYNQFLTAANGDKDTALALYKLAIGAQGKAGYNNKQQYAQAQGFNPAADDDEKRFGGYAVTPWDFDN